jgi:hypothetical protein
VQECPGVLPLQVGGRDHISTLRLQLPRKCPDTKSGLEAEAEAPPGQRIAGAGCCIGCHHAGQGDGEAGALAGCALAADAAAQAFGNAAADGEAKAGAAKAPCGIGVGLLEGFEDARQFIRGHADAGVGHRKAQSVRAVACHRDGERRRAR